jgi:hypothetical protein
VSFKSWRSYWEFSRKTRHDFRYIRDDEVDDFLNEVLRTSESRKRRLEEGSILWRSQIGGSTRPIDYDDEEAGDQPCPHPRERMLPFEYMASEGRVNPKGIPYLYLATDRNTAMGEARPWMGSQISVAQFRILRNLTVIDCSLNHLKNPFFFDLNKVLYEPSEREREESVWAHIDNAFSEPVVPNENESHYVPTQIIAELFKRNGFDGVVYKSMLGDGYNISLFDVNAAELINCQLCEAKKVEFEFEEVAAPYSIKKRDD